MQSASDTIGTKERRFLNEEYQSLKEEIANRSLLFNGFGTYF